MSHIFGMKSFALVCVFSIALITETSTHRAFNTPYSIPTDLADSIDQRLFPYRGSQRFLYQNSEDRRELEETKPLCEEERKSQSVRELILFESSNFLQTSNGLDIRKYNLIPRKVDIIKCVSSTNNEKSDAVCKPENCRERKVDVEVFGRLRNETSNTWEFMGTLSAIPVACECFVRWKPEKCSNSLNIFSEF